MKRLFSHLHRGFWIITVAVLLLLALVLTTARLTTPYLAKQRPRLETWTSSVLQQPVEIGTLKVGWHNFTPVLRCENINIWDDEKKTVLLKVNELDLGINLFTSLFTQKPQIRKIGISGATVTAYQNNDGSIALSGIGTFASHDKNKFKGLNDFMEWLLTAPRLTLKNITVNWYGNNQPLIPIVVHEINLRNYLFQNDLWGSATVMQTVPTQLNFAIKLHGGWFHKQNLTAKIYLKLQNIFLDQWLKNHPVDHFNLIAGEGNFEIWGTWKNQQWRRIQSLFTVKNISLKNDKENNPLQIPQANGNILWLQKNNHPWKFTVQFHDLTFDHWKKIPGFSNLKGFLQIEPQDGMLKLNSQNVIADFGPLFHAPLPFTKLTAIANWQQDNGNWIITTKNMDIETSDTTTTTNVDLTLPKDNSSPVINLSGTFQMRGKDHLADYIPIGVLSPVFVKWSETSITSLKNLSATFVMQGPLHNYPFDEHPGTFLVNSKISDMDLAYKPDWPALKQINGQLIFNKRRMEMQIDSARLLNIPVQQVQAVIPIIKKNVPETLQINNVIHADLADGLQFVQQSPLVNDSLRALNNMQGNGPFQLQLNLDIPLEHISPPLAVNGKLTLQNANLTIPDKNLQLQNLNGDLSFTRDSATAQGIQGKLWDKPFLMNIKTIAKAMQIQMNYQDYGITLTPQKAAWLMQLANQNVDGQIIIPNDKSQPIQANFSRIYLQPNTSQNLTQFKPAAIPAFNLTCNDFRYGDKQFGVVQVQLKHYTSTIDSINLKSTTPAFNLAVNGYWQPQQTQLTGAINTNNLAAALTNLGFPSADINASQTQLSFNLTWAGAAYDPSLKSMNGNFKLQIQKGTINNIDSGTAVKMDIGRLLSILSFQSIERRLKLDFSDLTSRGFSFDKISGDFKLQNGDAYTQNTLIDSAVAKVGINGRIGLATKDYNVLVSVTPNITSSLPLIIGLATTPTGIGPVVGAATWVASKLLSPAVNKITTDTYRMTGPWANPQINQVGSFWTGNKEH